MPGGTPESFARGGAGASGGEWPLIWDAVNVDLARVRHPHERVVLALSVLANAMAVACAIAIIYLAPQWLVSHGRVSELVHRVRLAAIAAVLLLPVLWLLRLGRWATFRESSVRLGRDQVPQLFAILDRHCRQVGVELPELYASTLESVGLSTAMEVARGRGIIVLGPNLFAGLDRVQDRADALAFVLAHELGRLVLGHATWWSDLVLGYLKRIPVLRLPLLTVQTASRDRFAMTVAPESARGFVLLAVGGDLLEHVDVAGFLRQVVAVDTPAAWKLMGELGRDGPFLLHRVRDLYRNGFLDLERAGRVDAPPAGPPYQPAGPPHQ